MTTEPTKNGPEPRGEQRSSMFLAAVLRAGAEQAPVKIRNMSTNGALLDTPLMPSPGTKVQLVRGLLIAEADVVWSANGRCGLSFSSEVTIKDWLLMPTIAEQQRVDAIVSLVKAGAVPTAFAGVKEAETSSYKNLVVDALGDVVKLLQDMEADLASADETLERHRLKIQNLDIALQMIRAVMRSSTTDALELEAAETDLKNLRAVCVQALALR